VELSEARARLEASGVALSALVADVRVEEARFHPAQGAWSILEVMGHLRIEEVEDFRTRLASTLRDPAAPWPKLDPEARVREERFDERDLGSLVTDFEEARAETLADLAALPAVDLGLTYQHPRGPIRAGDLLASWVAHDLLHLRQIVKNRYRYWSQRAAPYAPDYAGPW
jgi:hypothetical protein